VAVIKALLAAVTVAVLRGARVLSLVAIPLLVAPPLLVAISMLVAPSLLVAISMLVAPPLLLAISLLLATALVSIALIALVAIALVSIATTMTIASRVVGFATVVLAAVILPPAAQWLIHGVDITLMFRGVSFKSVGLCVFFICIVIDWIVEKKKRAADCPSGSCYKKKVGYAPSIERSFPESSAYPKAQP
jgi:hypothetical protein